MEAQLKIKIKVSDANTGQRIARLAKGMLNIPEDKLLQFCELSENNPKFWTKVANSLNNPLVRSHLK